MESLESIQKISSDSILATYKRRNILFTKGKGAYLWDSHGKKYLDFLAGIAVNNLGHAHPEIQKVVKSYSQKILHLSNLFLIPEQAYLAQKLVELSQLDKVFFCNSGAEAIEACLKLARYWGYKNGKRNEIIVLKNSFHGRTFLALSATAQKKYQDPFKPLVPGFKVVSLNKIEEIEKKITPKTVAILLEPVQGEGGVNLAEKSYLQKIQKLCKKKNILFILDEVQIGMGRSGSFFAYQYFALKPDLVALSKALGSGFPIGASLVSKKVAQAVEPGIHGSTFGGNPFASAMALRSIELISNPSFLKHVQKMSEVLFSQLYTLKKEFPFIEDIRGLGLLIAVQLKEKKAAEIVDACFEKGLICNAVQTHSIRLAPPLIIQEKEISEAIKILREVFQKC